MPDWCNLPPHIIERIAELVAIKEYVPDYDPDWEDYEDDVPLEVLQNQWLVTIRKLTMVCERWSDIILNCKGLFRDQESWSEHSDISMSWTNWPVAHIQFDANEEFYIQHMDLMPSQKANERATLLVKDGFMRYAKVLYISDSAPRDAIFLVRDHSQDSGVTKFKIDIDPSSWTTEHFNALIDVLRQSKPKSVYVCFFIRNTANAISFWSLFVDICHTCGNALDWLHFDLDGRDLQDVDWSFIVNREPGGKLIFVYPFENVPVENFCISFIADPYPKVIAPIDNDFEYVGSEEETKINSFLPYIYGMLDLLTSLKLMFSSLEFFAYYTQQSKNISENHEYIYRMMHPTAPFRYESDEEVRQMMRQVIRMVRYG